ncbi:MAG TPA: exodeoxyribonuclease VII small subunit [Ktedonobacteraceae bacterium]|nr:exodeoxyribonuclease VII small subunit [Ktedonobacteraceae bacterium]
MTDTLSFEEAYAKLDATVVALRDGQMPLEQALQYYEEGMKLAQYCNILLQKAELRMQQLGMDEHGDVAVRPFELS